MPNFVSVCSHCARAYTLVFRKKIWNPIETNEKNCRNKSVEQLGKSGSLEDGPWRSVGSQSWHHGWPTSSGEPRAAPRQQCAAYYGEAEGRSIDVCCHLKNSLAAAPRDQRHNFQQPVRQTEYISVISKHMRCAAHLKISYHRLEMLGRTSYPRKQSLWGSLKPYES
jgi:hypothetical protein